MGPLVNWGKSVLRKYGRHRTPSSRFPGYSDVTEIAAGPFAVVYRAVELGTSRPVALKVLDMTSSSAAAVEPFKEHLATLSLLGKHPNVVTLYRSFLTTDGLPVLVMELCRESYGQRAALRGPLAPAQVVPAAIKVAGALETAHRSGILHRDVKPQNILVSEGGEPVVADFGLVALQTLGQSTKRLAGAATLHAAPEVLEGQALSPATDVYGLASSVYELIVGRGPFVTYKGEEPTSVILRVLRDPAPRPPLSSMSIALADLLESSLAKDSLSRPQSAASFAESLRRIEAAAGWPETQYVVWDAVQLASPRPGATGAMGAAALRVLQPSAQSGHQAKRGGRAPEARGGGAGSGATAGSSASGAAGASGSRSRSGWQGQHTFGDPSLSVGQEAAADRKSEDGVAAVPSASSWLTESPPNEEAPGEGQLTGGMERVQLVDSVWDYVGPLIESPPKGPKEQPPPGTRSVVMPPPTQRTVLVPKPVAARWPPPPSPPPLPAPVPPPAVVPESPDDFRRSQAEPDRPGGASGREES